jgi:hypothetical protein
MQTSSARQAFDARFTPFQATQLCDRILTDSARRLVRTTGANGNLFPILDQLAAFKDGKLVEHTLENARPQDVALLLGLELVRLNSRRMFTLNVTVDPERRNGRLCNWGDPTGS